MPLPEKPPDWLKENWYRGSLATVCLPLLKFHDARLSTRAHLGCLCTLRGSAPVEISGLSG